MVKIHQVIENLDVTIKGKQLLLMQYESENKHPIVIQFLKINLEELKRIRNDLYEN